MLLGQRSTPAVRVFGKDKKWVQFPSLAPEEYMEEDKELKILVAKLERACDEAWKSIEDPKTLTVVRYIMKGKPLTELGLEQEEIDDIMVGITQTVLAEVRLRQARRFMDGLSNPLTEGQWGEIEDDVNEE